MKNFLRRLLGWNAELICMRLADMHRVHPDQVTLHCSSCGHEIGVYPSGQEILRRHPDARLFCQVCKMPGAQAVLAPGARLEAFQSEDKK